MGEVSVTDIGWGFTSVYAVHSGAGVVLVEAQNPGKEDRILRRLDRAGLDADAVTAIVVTHGHPDHAGSAAALGAELGVPTIAAQADLPYFEAGTAPFTPTGGLGRLVSLFVHSRFPPFTPDRIVDDVLSLEPYGIAGTLRVVGGHSPGSLVVELPGGTVLVGDLIRSALIRHHVPKLHFFHEDEAGADAALAGILARGATEILPTHGGALEAADVAAWLSQRVPPKP